MGYLGEISYSLYVWHLPIIELFIKYPNALPFSHWYFNFAFFVFPIVLILSCISYHIIEKPFFAMRRVYIRRDANLSDKLETSGFK